MSKSDQFAVPADASESVPVSPNQSRRQIARWGCGSIVLLIVIAVIIGWAIDSTAQQQPVNQQQVIRSLAGVPVYPGATFDEDLTREARGKLAVFGLFNPNKFKTTAGLRTPDGSSEVIPFYDGRMVGYGFVKTTLGGNLFGTENYLGGASYTSADTTVLVQMYREEGEDNRLVIIRFDRQSRSVLSQPTNVVTPEDFEKAAREAEQKKKQAEQQKAVPQK